MRYHWPFSEVEKSGCFTWRSYHASLAIMQREDAVLS